MLPDEGNVPVSVNLKYLTNHNLRSTSIGFVCLHAFDPFD